MFRLLGKLGAAFGGSIGGDPLGAELAVNGTFDTDVVGWSDVSQGFPTWDAGRMLVTPSPALGGGGQGVTTESGKAYRVSIDFERGTTANVQFWAGTAAQNADLHNSGAIVLASGTYTFDITATSVTSWIVVLGFTDGGTAWFDNISVKEIL